MKITSDWHVHSCYSCDSASLTFDDLVSQAETLGIENFGITDHVHTPLNLPDIDASYKDYCNYNLPFFHFGIEVSCVSRWELEEINKRKNADFTYGLRSGGPPDTQLAIGISEEDISKYNIEFVVGGTHWPMYVPIERQSVINDYHRQNMFLATHPLVDIVAHPWWWMKYWRDSDGLYTTKPWFDDFSVIPKSMHDEFAAASIEHNKIIEINLSAMLLTQNYTDDFKKQYLDYLAYLKDAGATLCIGSDCHSPNYHDIDFPKAAQMLETVGFKENDLWKIPGLVTPAGVTS